jgi:hypothetical protein
MDALFPRVLLSKKSLNGTSVVTSPAVDLRFAVRAESLLLLASKSGGTANISIRYAISRDGKTVDGNYQANRPLVDTLQGDFPNSAKVWNAIVLPNFLAPYLFLQFRGVTGNPATGVSVSATIYIREELRD